MKIDGSFVQGADQSAEKLAIIRSILGLAMELNTTTLAEGIETQAQVELLRREGCDQAQGLLLVEPIPLRELVKLDCHSLTTTEDLDANINENIRLLRSQLVNLDREEKVA